VQGSRMRGDIPPLPQYAFMAWCSVKRKGTGTALPLPYSSLMTITNPAPNRPL